MLLRTTGKAPVLAALAILEIRNGIDRLRLRSLISNDAERRSFRHGTIDSSIDLLRPVGE